MQVKVKKADNDLLIEQLREIFRALAAERVPTNKLEKRLDEVAHKWDEIKKLQPQVKGSVEPIQVSGLPKVFALLHLLLLQLLLLLPSFLAISAACIAPVCCPYYSGRSRTAIPVTEGWMCRCTGISVGAVDAQRLQCKCCCLQATQADRIRKDIEAFSDRVQQCKSTFHSRPVYKFSTGTAAAYAMLDAAAAELAKLRKDSKQFAELASIFELTDAMVPITAALQELFDDLVAIKDSWDCTMMCEVQFHVSNHAAACARLHATVSFIM
jgi:hypothetical protein